MQISSNLHSNVSRSTRINSSSVHTYIFACFTLRVFLQGFVTQNATWCQKYNNSVNRIISKEEEREDPRRDSSIYLRVQWCFHIPTRFLRIQCILQCFHTQSSKFPVIPCYSAYRINSSTRNTTTTRLIPCHPVQAPSSNCSPCLQAFYTAE